MHLGASPQKQHQHPSAEKRTHTRQPENHPPGSFNAAQRASEKFYYRDFAQSDVEHFAQNREAFPSLARSNTTAPLLPSTTQA